MLNEHSPFEAYRSTDDFPAEGSTDTFYFDLSSEEDEQNTELSATENDPPSTGDVYIWNGTSYELYCQMQDTNFIGPRPADPPHKNL